MVVFLYAYAEITKIGVATGAPSLTACRSANSIYIFWNPGCFCAQAQHGKLRSMKPLIKLRFERARLYRLRKSTCFVTGHDFSRAASAIKSTWALAPEGCFSGFSLAICPLSAAFSALDVIYPLENDDVATIGLSPQGLKAGSFFELFAARLKSCPVTEQKSFCGCKAGLLVWASMAPRESPPCPFKADPCAEVPWKPAS